MLRYKIKVKILFADVDHLRNKLFDSREASELNKKHIEELLKDTVNSGLERKRLKIQEFVEERRILSASLEFATKNSRLQHDDFCKGKTNNIISIIFFPVITSMLESKKNYPRLGSCRNSTTSTRPSYPTIS